jgi:hypothetical protein
MKTIVNWFLPGAVRKRLARCGGAASDDAHLPITTQQQQRIRHLWVGFVS